MKLRISSLAGVWSLIAVSSAAAAPIYWNGSAGNLWSNAANWSANADGTGSASVPGSADVATFNATSLTGAAAITVDSAQAVSGLNFLGQASVTITSDGTPRTITLGTGGITAAGTTTSSSTPTRVYTIGSTTAANNLNLSLLGSQSWLSNIGGSLFNAGDGIMVRANVSLGVAGTHTLTLGGSSGSTPQNLISGVISDGGSDRVLNIALNPGGSNGGNRWSLTGNNTYTGTTVISNGALTLGHVNALGATSSGTTVQSGGGLFFRSTVGTMAAEALTLSGNGPDEKGALRNVNGDNTWTGAISLASGTVSIGSDGGTLTLGSTANITTSVASSTLRFVTTSATATSFLIVRGNISGAISVDKGYGTNNSPNATVTFADTAKSYTGATTVSSGTLVLNTGLTGTSGVTVAAGATLRGNNGSVNNLATTTVNGNLAMGATSTPSLGALGMGQLNLGATSSLAIDINSATLASDVLTLSGLNGNLNITNGAVLTLNDLASASLTSGALMFIQYSGVWNGGLFTVNGTLIGDNSQAVYVNGNFYQIDYNYVNGGQTGVALVAVPEAGATMLGALSLAGLVVRRRK